MALGVIALTSLYSVIQNLSLHQLFFILMLAFVLSCPAQSMFFSTFVLVCAFTLFYEQAIKWYAFSRVEIKGLY